MKSRYIGYFNSQWQYIILFRLVFWNHLGDIAARWYRRVPKAAEECLFRLQAVPQSSSRNAEAATLWTPVGQHRALQVRSAIASATDNPLSVVSLRANVSNGLLITSRLQEENDYLVGKHSQHAEQLQNETINLPDNLQELQYVVLNLREDLIAAKVCRAWILHPPPSPWCWWLESWCAQVAKEASEKKCQAETLFIKDQLAGEQQAKESLENSLSAEIDYLREQLGLMRSVHTQLDEESSRKASLEVALQKTKQQLAEQQQFASESASVKVQLQSDSIKYFVACHQMSERNVAENLSHFLLCWFGLG